ncbi:hypothetical protein ACJX0J_031198, partial [Zea mays]
PTTLMGLVIMQMEKKSTSIFILYKIIKKYSILEMRVLVNFFYGFSKLIYTFSIYIYIYIFLIQKFRSCFIGIDHLHHFLGIDHFGHFLGMDCAQNCINAPAVDKFILFCWEVRFVQIVLYFQIMRDDKHHIFMANNKMFLATPSVVCMSCMCFFINGEDGNYEMQL